MEDDPISNTFSYLRPTLPNTPLLQLIAYLVGSPWTKEEPLIEAFTELFTIEEFCKDVAQGKALAYFCRDLLCSRGVPVRHNYDSSVLHEVCKALYGEYPSKELLIQIDSFKDIVDSSQGRQPQSLIDQSHVAGFYNLAIVTAVSNHMKDLRFSGRTTESLSETLNEWDTIARDLQLSSESTRNLFHNAFSGEARRFYQSSVLPWYTFEQARDIMMREYSPRVL